MSRRIIYLSLLIFSPVFFFLVYSSQSSRKTVISLDPAITYQTMMGWEAVAQAGQKDCRDFDQYKDELFDAAVNDLGINRLRVAIRPTGSNSVKFDISGFDNDIEKVVIPMMKLSDARGENLFVNVNFLGASGFTSQPDMSAYAEQVLEVYNHMQAKYGFYPSAWEVALEPRVVTPDWRAQHINDAVTRTSDLLSANGINDPYLIAPSSACGPEKALNAFDEMLRFNNGVPPRGLNEFAYHRYCIATDQQLKDIADLRTTYGFNISMLEHGGADYEELHADLKIANVSAWQQFALAYCTDDNGFQYYPVQGDTFSQGERTKFLRQYFKFIRFGAVRIQATADSIEFDPLAFINTNGTYVIVVKAEIGGAFGIRGLPEGTYGIKYTTGHQDDVDLTDVTLRAGQELETAIPEKGVITIYTLTDSPQNSFSSSIPARDNLSSAAAGNRKSCYINTIHLCRKK
jgi:hypothetical protein